jgi:hypothetical protein
MSDLALFFAAIGKAGWMTGIGPGIVFVVLLRRFHVVAFGFEYEQDQRAGRGCANSRIRRRDEHSRRRSIRWGCDGNLSTLFSHDRHSDFLRVRKTLDTSGLVPGAIRSEQGASEVDAEDATRTMASQIEIVQVHRRGLVGGLVDVWAWRKTFTRSAAARAAENSGVPSVQVSGDGQLAKAADFNSSELNIRATSPSRNRWRRA